MPLLWKTEKNSIGYKKDGSKEPSFLLEIGNEGGIRRVGFLGEAFQIV